MSMKRDEAIEVVRKNLPHLGIGATEMTKALETLIPELRESEDENALRYLHELISFGYTEKFFDAQTAADMRDWVNKSLHPQPRKEIYHAAKRDLVIRFLNYLDENRPEGKRCLSNGECEDVVRAFKENDWAKIVRYYEKYRPRWKPSEEQMKALQSAIVFKEIRKASDDDITTLNSLYEQLKKL